jgi:hypothetical protein
MRGITAIAKRQNAHSQQKLLATAGSRAAAPAAASAAGPQAGAAVPAAAAAELGATPHAGAAACGGNTRRQIDNYLGSRPQPGCAGHPPVCTACLPAHLTLCCAAG